jgi:ferredoxin
VLPRAWFSDPVTKQRGLARRLLRRLGTTWLSSPVRRASQAVCFVTFLVLFFYVCFPYTARPVDSAEAVPGAWPSHYADDLARKETVAAELFLTIDPLLSLSTFVASKSWVWSLTCAGVILAVCVLIPRGFCGYLCPLGTLIDLFDWAIAGRVKRFNVGENGWWVHIKYYLLLGVMVAALCGVLLSGFVAAIPVITRGMLYLFSPLQTGFVRGAHQMPPLNVGQVFSIVLFFSVLALGFLKPRFWCKYVCPSGAVFSLGNLFRASERKVETSCIHCNKCVEICPFDAIKPDFTTRVTDCTLCQTCAGVCPTQAIKFVDRFDLYQLKMPNDPPTHETAIGRRGFLAAAVGVTAGTLGGAGAAAGTKLFGANLDNADGWRPIRPPGSVPEREFLQMCIRCGECFKACPNDVLQPLAFEQGFEGLWTPQVVPNWAGCESSCNACTQVCPTGAIRAIDLAEKKVCRIGLAVVNESTCLPYAGREACQLCVDECSAAGYHAIEFTRVGTEVDSDGNPVEDSGYLAPVVLADKCVGCGLCQTRCYGLNALDKKLLKESAIIIHAGGDREDRMMRGSYIALRAQEQAAREAEQKKALESQGINSENSYLPPDF